ncbi:MAG: CrcB family protein, partial [Candidatus Adiutrix sp.]|nr:CrcB family protein [Candidatus Adiutrix sp.]
MIKVLAVFAGGGAGALIRWLMAVKLNPAPSEGPAFPAGTLAVNLGGGFLIGLLMAAFTARSDWSEEGRLLLVTGFLGGLTTFSAFSWEII